MTFASRNERELLKCLGREEKEFHLEKKTGPIYELNQRLISEMVQIPGAELTEEAYRIVCHQTETSPTLKLLELSIIQGKEIFILKPSVKVSDNNISQSMIEDYLEASTEIFLHFISQIQTQAPSAQCLKEEIPELESFLRDIKYLQEDVHIKKIFNGREIPIFKKLKNYPQLFKKCRERIKKKLKSASKPER
jgi:hypothetical protein